MRPPDNTKTYKYTLIEYGESRRDIERLKPVKKTKLTVQEAHDLNYALALNGSTKRYVKS